MHKCIFFSKPKWLQFSSHFVCDSHLFWIWTPCDELATCPERIPPSPRDAGIIATKIRRHISVSESIRKGADHGSVVLHISALFSLKVPVQRFLCFFLWINMEQIANWEKENLHWACILVGLIFNCKQKDVHCCSACVFVCVCAFVKIKNIPFLHSFSVLCPPLGFFFRMAFNAPITHKCPGMRLFW